MIFLFFLLTILVTSNGLLMSNDDYTIWDNLNLFQDEQDYVMPIENSKEQESLETGFHDDDDDDVNLSTTDQNHGSPNSVIRSATLKCGSSSTEEPEYLDYDEPLRVNGAPPAREFRKSLFYGVLVLGFLFGEFLYF